MVNINIKVTHEVTREMLEDIFVTALEGGSNYWCEIDLPSNAFMREHKNEATSIIIFKAVYDHGMKIRVFDVDDDDEGKVAIGELDVTNFEKRLQKLIDDGNGHHLMAQIDDAGAADAESADVVFQYLSLGEVVYG